jgi:ribosomal protein S18 acetylase RimI-like enzyme
MAQTDTSIRRATDADAALLAELGARTFFDTFADSTKPEDMAAYLSAAFGEGVQAAELADAASTFFVAETDGAASGYAKLHAGEAEACVAGREPVELARLYVLREWLGRGVGEALMQSCVEEARRSGYLTMWLGVWEHNARAQAFYRRWGFRVVGEHVFRVGSDPQTDLIMERALV